MKILITGSSGFIGFHLSKLLLKKKYKVVGIDNMNNYYSIKLKKNRLKELKKNKNFKFYKIDLTNENKLREVFKKNKFDAVFNLAAQAGVRYSVDHPKKYIESNIIGFFNIIENIKQFNIKKFYYASSSSVYGNSKKFPLNENQFLLPTNTYSLSKKFNEDLSLIYTKFYKINAVGLRFFTVYGEWGRPDMFYSKVLDACFKRKKLYLNNFGNHERDFTYINDVCIIMYNLLKCKKIKKNKILNICSSKPINIIQLVKIIEKNSKKINIYKRKIQQADVLKTHGSNKKIKSYSLIKSFTPLHIGINNMLSWYKKYHGI